MRYSAARRLGATATGLSAPPSLFLTPGVAMMRSAASGHSSSSFLSSFSSMANSTAALACARRNFWNPFAAFNTACTPMADSTQDPVGQRNAAQHASIVEQAHRDADLQNEQLLDSCLALLELCGGDAAGSASSTKLDQLDRETIWTLVDVMLHDHRRRPSEQFDLVYTALCLPAAQEHRDVQRSLIVVLHTVLPEPLFRVFESVNLYVLHDDEQSLQQRDVLIRLVHALLGDLNVPDGLEEEEVLAVYLDDVQHLFPALQTTPAWKTLSTDASTIALKAKLFALLGRLCIELDEDRSGKVKLADLQSTAKRVLGEEQAVQLLEGALPDKDGKIAYPQLAALLTRPPPKVETKKAA